MPPRDDGLFILEYEKDPTVFQWYEQARYIRLKRGMTQQELADISGVSVVTISNFECGKRMMTVDRMIWIVEVLRCTLDEYSGRVRIKKGML